MNSQNTSVHKFISAYQQTPKESLLCQLLQDLVRIPTVNPPGANYSEMVDFLANLSGSLGLEVEKHQVNASDAIQKRKFLGQTNQSLLNNDADSIEIIINTKKKIVEIVDTGIGLTKN